MTGERRLATSHASRRKSAGQHFLHTNTTAREITMCHTAVHRRPLTLFPRVALTYPGSIFPEISISSLPSIAIGELARGADGAELGRASERTKNERPDETITDAARECAIRDGRE